MDPNAKRSTEVQIPARRVVYGVGQIGYRFRSHAQKLAIAQELQAEPTDSRALLDYLERNTGASASLVWTLEIDSLPIYALVPREPGAAELDLRFQRLLREQLAGRVERVAIPGEIDGEATLLSCPPLPQVRPVPRGITASSPRALLESGASTSSRDATAECIRFDLGRQSRAARDLLDRIGDLLRNRGLKPRERALNFGANWPRLLERVCASAVREGMGLDDVQLARSPVGRRGSDCWDLSLILIDAEAESPSSRRVYRMTINVGDVVPLAIGEIHEWSIR
jgi:hypothetical protein